MCFCAGEKFTFGINFSVSLFTVWYLSLSLGRSEANGHFDLHALYIYICSERYAECFFHQCTGVQYSADMRSRKLPNHQCLKTINLLLKSGALPALTVVNISVYCTYYPLFKPQRLRERRWGRISNIASELAREGRFVYSSDCPYKFSNVRQLGMYSLHSNRRPLTGVLPMNGHLVLISLVHKTLYK